GLDRIVLLEDADENRRAGHELNELAEEAALAVDGVEAFSDFLRELEALERDDLEARVLDLGEDCARLLLFDGVGLDDEKGAFGGHGVPLYRAKCASSRASFRAKRARGWRRAEMPRKGRRGGSRACPLRRRREARPNRPRRARRARARA